MDKRADIPFWLMMTLLILISMIVLLLIIGQGGKYMVSFTEWLRGVF